MDLDAMETDTGRLVAEVAAAQSGERLDRFLTDALPDMSRTRIQALIREGQVRIAVSPSSSATIEDVKYLSLIHISEPTRH